MGISSVSPYPPITGHPLPSINTKQRRDYRKKKFHATKGRDGPFFFPRFVHHTLTSRTPLHSNGGNESLSEASERPPPSCLFVLVCPSHLFPLVFSPPSIGSPCPRSHGAAISLHSGFSNSRGQTPNPRRRHLFARPSSCSAYLVRCPFRRIRQLTTPFSPVVHNPLLCNTL